MLTPLSTHTASCSTNNLSEDTGKRKNVASQLSFHYSGRHIALTMEITSQSALMTLVHLCFSIKQDFVLFFVMVVRAEQAQEHSSK